MDAYLSATQFGVTVTQPRAWRGGRALHGASAGATVPQVGIHNAPFITGAAWALGLTFITFLHIIIGELAPKYLGIRNPLSMSLMLVRPLQLFIALFKPFIWLLNVSANFILRRVFRLSPVANAETRAQRGGIARDSRGERQGRGGEPDGKEILINAPRLQKRVVRDITTPRGEVVFLNTEDSFEENVKRSMESRHTRFPLCRGHLDDTIGLVHIKDLLRLVREPKPNIESIRRELHNVPEMMPLEKLLSFFLGRTRTSRSWWMSSEAPRAS